MSDYTDPEWLRQKYHGEGMSLGEVAAEAGCSDATVRRHMVEHGIERRSGGPPTTRRELAEDIRRVADEIGGTPSRADYRGHGEHSAQTVSEKFGTWVDGREVALDCPTGAPCRPGP